MRRICWPAASRRVVPGPRPGWLAPVLLAALLTTAGCSSPSPKQRLAGALRSTLDGSFAYQLEVEADRAALRGLGGAAPQAATVLRTVRVEGRHAPDAETVTLRLLGIDAVEVRDLPDHRLYLRVGLGQLLTGFEGAAQPGAGVAALLERAGAPDQVVAAARAAAEGRWVGIIGRLDTAKLRRAAGPTPGPRPVPAAAALGGDIAGFVERYVEVHRVTEQEDATTYAAAVTARELLGALAQAAPGEEIEDLRGQLAGVPRRVPMTVTVADGKVTTIVVDLTGAQGASPTPDGATTGSVRLRLEVTDHGNIVPIDAPQPAVSISAEQLLEALEGLNADTLPVPVPPTGVQPPDGLPLPVPAPTPPEPAVTPG